MTKEEFNFISNLNKEEPRLITIDDLSNKEDHTLIYGYTCDRDTFEVYIENGNIKKAITKFNQEPVQYPITCNEDYVPNKRVYPAKSDFDFCTLLILAGVYVSFTVFID